MTFISCLFVVLYGLFVPSIAIGLILPMRRMIWAGERGWFSLQAGALIFWCVLALWVGTNIGPIAVNTECQHEHVEEFETEGGVSI